MMSITTATIQDEATRNSPKRSPAAAEAAAWPRLLAAFCVPVAVPRFAPAAPAAATVIVGSDAPGAKSDEPDQAGDPGIGDQSIAGRVRRGDGRSIPRRARLWAAARGSDRASTAAGGSTRGPGAPDLRVPFGIALSWRHPPRNGGLIEPRKGDCPPITLESPQPSLACP